MNKLILSILLFVFVFSCVPKNGVREIKENSKIETTIELTIWRNKMPTMTPSQFKVIAVFDGGIKLLENIEEFRFVACGVKTTEGEELSSLTMDSLPVYNNPENTINFSLRGEADFPDVIPSNTEVIGWMLFFIDGIKIEINTEPVIVKDVY